MITIQTQIEVSTAALGDVAITAAEGGIGYWSVIQSYDFERWSPEEGNVEVPEDFVFYTLEWEGREPAEELIDVTPLLLARGIGYVMRMYAIEDISEMDSDMADLVVQYGAFGEQVFG